MFLPNLFFPLLVVCLLREVACYFDCSSIHSSDYSDYAAILDPNSCSDRCYPYTEPGSCSDSCSDPDYILTHTKPALLSHGPTGTL